MLNLLLSCEVRSLHYLGFINNKFRFSKKREGIYIQPLVFEHFSSHGHNSFLEDCRFTLTDKTVGTDTTRWILDRRFEDCYSL